MTTPAANTTAKFDADALRRAIESGATAGQPAAHTPDAELTTVDWDHPSSNLNPAERTYYSFSSCLWVPTAPSRKTR